MRKFVKRIISGNEFSDSFLELRRNLIYECDEFIKELSSEKLKDFHLKKVSVFDSSIFKNLQKTFLLKEIWIAW